MLNLFFFFFFNCLRWWSKHNFRSSEIHFAENLWRPELSGGNLLNFFLVIFYWYFLKIIIFWVNLKGVFWVFLWWCQNFRSPEISMCWKKLETWTEEFRKRLLVFSLFNFEVYKFHKCKQLAVPNKFLTHLLVFENCFWFCPNMSYIC